LRAVRSRASNRDDRAPEEALGGFLHPAGRTLRLRIRAVRRDRRPVCGKFPEQTHSRFSSGVTIEGRVRAICTGVAGSDRWFLGLRHVWVALPSLVLERELLYCDARGIRVELAQCEVLGRPATKYLVRLDDLTRLIQ